MRRSQTKPLVPLFLVFVGVWPPVMASATTCVECHATETPQIVSDWKLRKHSENGIECAACHGDKHTSSQDVAKVTKQDITCLPGGAMSGSIIEGRMTSM